MDARRLTGEQFIDVLLQSCDICRRIATDPVATTCGHLYCWPCLSEQPRLYRCLVCEAPIEEELVARATAPSRRPVTISSARIARVHNMVDQMRERNHTRQVELLLRLSEVRGQRIQELEQALDQVMHMNSTLLVSMEDLHEASARIAEQEHRLARPSGRIAEPEDRMVRHRNDGFGWKVAPILMILVSGLSMLMIWISIRDIYMSIVSGMQP